MPKIPWYSNETDKLSVLCESVVFLSDVIIV